MDGGAWWAAFHGVAKSRTWLSDFTFTFHFHASEKEMATHSSVLAWRILGMGQPGELMSMESHRVGHDWSDLAAAASQLNIWKQHHLLLSCAYSQTGSEYHLMCVQITQVSCSVGWWDLRFCIFHEICWWLEDPTLSGKGPLQTCEATLRLFQLLVNVVCWRWNWTLLYPRRGSQVVLVVKNLPASAGDIRDSDSTPGLGRSSGEGDGNPLQYSCLGDAVDRGAWRAMGHGSQRIRHYWSDLAHTYAHWYRHYALWCSGHLNPLCTPVPHSSSLPSPLLPPSLLPLLCLMGQKKKKENLQS